MSRNTVKLYTDRFNACAFNPEQVQQLDDTGPHAIAYADARQMQDNDSTLAFTLQLPYFLAELKRTGIIKYLLLQEYKKDRPEECGYSRFCDLFAQYRKVHEASDRRTSHALFKNLTKPAHGYCGSIKPYGHLTLPYFMKKAV